MTASVLRLQPREQIALMEPGTLRVVPEYKPKPPSVRITRDVVAGVVAETKKPRGRNPWAWEGIARRRKVRAILAAAHRMIGQDDLDAVAERESVIVENAQPVTSLESVARALHVLPQANKLADDLYDDARLVDYRMADVLVAKVGCDDDDVARAAQNNERRKLIALRLEGCQRGGWMVDKRFDTPEKRSNVLALTARKGDGGVPIRRRWFCGMRECPDCARSRAERWRRRVEQAVKETFKARKPFFITLTQRDRVGATLEEEYTRAVNGLDTFTKTKLWRDHIHGAVVTVEVTWSTPTSRRVKMTKSLRASAIRSAVLNGLLPDEAKAAAWWHVHFHILADLRVCKSTVCTACIRRVQLDGNGDEKTEDCAACCREHNHEPPRGKTALCTTHAARAWKRQQYWNAADKTAQAACGIIADTPEHPHTESKTAAIHTRATARLTLAQKKQAACEAREARARRAAARKALSEVRGRSPKAKAERAAAREIYAHERAKADAARAARDAARTARAIAKTQAAAARAHAAMIWAQTPDGAGVWKRDANAAIASYCPQAVDKSARDAWLWQHALLSTWRASLGLWGSTDPKGAGVNVQRAASAGYGACEVLKYPFKGIDAAKFVQEESENAHDATGHDDDDSVANRSNRMYYRTPGMLRLMELLRWQRGRRLVRTYGCLRKKHLDVVDDTDTSTPYDDLHNDALAEAGVTEVVGYSEADGQPLNKTQARFDRSRDIEMQACRAMSIARKEGRDTQQLRQLDTYDVATHTARATGVNPTPLLQVMPQQGAWARHDAPKGNTEDAGKVHKHWNDVEHIAWERHRYLRTAERQRPRRFARTTPKTTTDDSFAYALALVRMEATTKETAANV